MVPVLGGLGRGRGQLLVLLDELLVDELPEDREEQALLYIYRERVEWGYVYMCEFVWYGWVGYVSYVWGGGLVG